MSKIRFIYIVSLVILAGLIVLAVFRPMAANEKYSEVQKEQLLETESEWIIQLDIINHEGKDQNYTINVQVDNDQFSIPVQVRDGAKFSFLHSIHRNRITDGVVSFNIYKEGETTPFEQATYHLK